MKPVPAVQKVFLAGSILAFAALFGSLLKDTWDASAPFEPEPIHRYVLPILGGAFGLVLALALGVDPARGAAGWRAFFTIDRLLLVGALVYAAAAVVGGYVWYEKAEITPELVTTLVLIVVGYAATLVAALGRK